MPQHRSDHREDGRDDGREAGPGPGSDKGTLRLWLRLLTCATLLEKELGARMRRSFGVSLSRFDVLAQLDRAGDGLTMSQLSSRVMVTNGNVTSLVRGLEAAGMVERVSHPADRRVIVVNLTARGAERFRAMAAAHAGWVSEILADVPAADRDALMTLLQRVERSARAAVTASSCAGAVADRASGEPGAGDQGAAAEGAPSRDHTSLDRSSEHESAGA